MPHEIDDILQTLHAARTKIGLSQRALSARIGVPQSHISKIESGATDLRLSSLRELARALNYELVLVPRKLLPVVESIIDSASLTLAEEVQRRTTILNRAQSVVAKLSRAHHHAAELKHLYQTLRELANFQLGKADLDTVHAATNELLRLSKDATAPSAFEPVSRHIRALRNRIAHAPPEPPRPAYELDEEDDYA